MKASAIEQQRDDGQPLYSILFASAIELDDAKFEDLSIVIASLMKGYGIIDQISRQYPQKTEVETSQKEQ